MQQHPTRRFKRPSMVVGITGIKHRPATSTVSRTRGSSAALAGAPFGVDQRAQIVEAVRCQQSCGDKFPESGFHFSLQFARAAHNICKEGSAALSQKLQDRCRVPAQTRRLDFARFAPRNHPVAVFAHKKGNGRDAGGNDAPLSVRERFKRSGVRRQPAPADRAGEAKMVKHLGIEIGDAALENLAFPRICRRFEALHLTNGFERASFAEQLRARCDVLPAKQPIHELRRSHRLDFRP